MALARSTGQVTQGLNGQRKELGFYSRSFMERGNNNQVCFEQSNLTRELARASADLNTSP